MVKALDMTMLDLFEMSKRKKEVDYPEGVAPLDLWYDRTLYGRVDSNFDPVYIHQSFTKLTELDSNSRKLVQALDFVAEAFSDFRGHYHKALAYKKIKTENTLISKITPIKGYISFDQVYLSYVKALIIPAYSQFLLTSKRDKTIANFNDHMSAFKRFVTLFSSVVPITRSAFLKSNACTFYVSGLAVDISEQDYDDFELSKTWYKDPNFRFYKNAAAKFGFFVDKYSPWRLIADISSREMQKYMQKAGLEFNPGTSTNLFQSYYTRTYEEEIEELKDIVLECYNNHINLRPYTSILETKECYIQKTLTSFIYRKPYTRQKLDQEYNLNTWYHLYHDMRLGEEALSLSEIRHAQRMLEIDRLSKVLDKTSIVRYINRQMKRDKSKTVVPTKCQNFVICACEENNVTKFSTPFGTLCRDLEREVFTLIPPEPPSPYTPVKVELPPPPLPVTPEADPCPPTPPGDSGLPY